MRPWLKPTLRFVQQKAKTSRSGIRVKDVNMTMTIGEDNHADDDVDNNSGLVAWTCIDETIQSSE